MMDGGVPSEDDVRALRGVLEMLESKKGRLEAQREEIDRSVRAIRAEMRREVERREKLEQLYAHWDEQIQDLPSQADSLTGHELTVHVAELKDKIAAAEVRIAKQSEVKRQILTKVCAPPMERSRRTSLRFIHNALLNELSDLVRADASPATLQQKDKQIQLCEAARNL
jgi:chromosome segregation ATPase